MAGKSTVPYQFGDLLALARRSWVAQMAEKLAIMGFDDYRRSDAAVLRMLRQGPLSIGRLGEALGTTRQAARKVAAGLERRGLATTRRDEHDARQVNVCLTAQGETYSRAVVTAIDELNQELRHRVDPADLAGADAVLRAVLVHRRDRDLANRLRRPPAGGRRPSKPGSSDPRPLDPGPSSPAVPSDPRTTPPAITPDTPNLGPVGAP